MNYQDKIKELVKKYNLTYTFNAGGAQFHSRNLEEFKQIDSFINNCQIFTWNDEQDYKILEKWLINYPIDIR